jgi:hypothetical protein
MTRIAISDQSQPPINIAGGQIGSRSAAARSKGVSRTSTAATRREPTEADCDTAASPPSRNRPRLQVSVVATILQHANTSGAVLLSLLSQRSVCSFGTVRRSDRKSGNRRRLVR